MSKNKTAAKPAYTNNTFDKFFRISERGSTLGREVRGGFVTFFAMAYIIILNPIILAPAVGQTGLTAADIASGTAFVAGILTILMGVVANFPLAVAAGMGLNAMVAFTLVLGSNLTYGEAMGLIFWEGVAITVLVLTGFREAVFRAVPQQLKIAISVGIGLFIAFVGLLNAGIIRPGGTPVQLGINGSLNGWPALVFVVGLLVTIILYVRKIRGAILIGIVSSSVLAVIIQLIANVPPKSEDVPTGWGLNVPAIENATFFDLPSFKALGQIDFFGAFGKLGPVAALLIIFSLMLVDFFDTMGTMVAIGQEGDLLDKNGNPPRVKQILLIDSLGAVAGGLGGVSSNTSYIESSAGVGEGARTGFASVVTGILFLLSMFIAPVVALVPSEAASTALVFVGFLMMMQVAQIDWKKPDIAIPAFLTIAFMPFSYSISVGIGVGVVVYFVLQLALGKIRSIHPLMWIITILFILYFVLGPIQALLA